jgi:alpha-tubulin suppressor-like RCC1 family protein
LGRLGGGSPIPLAVADLSNVNEFSAAAETGCALLADHSLRCWGWAFFGAVGNGTLSNTGIYKPVTVTGIANAIGIYGGYAHFCALLADSTVKCWGSNADGQLGDQTHTNQPEPQVVAGLSGVTALAPGFRHTCALMSDHTVQCWGKNTNGQLGNGTTGATLRPVAVSNLDNAVAVSAGREHTCAVLEDGRLQCWGDNQYGQLGTGTGKITEPATVVGF